MKDASFGKKHQLASSLNTGMWSSKQDKGIDLSRKVMKGRYWRLLKQRRSRSGVSIKTRHLNVDWTWRHWKTFKDSHLKAVLQDVSSVHVHRLSLEVRCSNCMMISEMRAEEESCLNFWFLFTHSLGRKLEPGMSSFRTYAKKQALTLAFMQRKVPFWRENMRELPAPTLPYQNTEPLCGKASGQARTSFWIKGT